MATQEQQPINEYVITDSPVTNFSYTFLITKAEEIQVFKNDIKIPRNNDTYSVSGIGNASGGTVVFASGFRLEEDDIIRLLRETAIERPTDYTRLGDITADSLNNDADTQLRILQEIRRFSLSLVSRALQVVFGPVAFNAPVEHKADINLTNSARLLVDGAEVIQTDLNVVNQLKFIDPVPDWEPNTQITDQLLVYRSPDGDLISPKTRVPFITGSSFDADNWNPIQVSSGVVPLEVAQLVSANLPIGTEVVLIDRGYARFKIEVGESFDGMSVINAGDSKVARLQYAGKLIEPIWLGAAADGVTDDTVFLQAADAIKGVYITERYKVNSSVSFSNKVIFSGGALVPNSTSVNINFAKNRVLHAKNFGAMADAVQAGETVTGTDDYIAIQVGLFSCARTNGKITFRAGGGDYRCDTGLVNTISNTGSCSIIGRGLLGFRLLTEQNITALHIGGSAQTIKRIYILFVNPTAALTGQIGVRFASDDFQWSQSVMEQVWVVNPHVGFYQENESGVFGTIFLNAYRNCQIINNRDWGINFDSKNGSTTIHLDTCYVKGVGSSAKGIRIRSVKDVLMSNTAIDSCVNNALDIAAVNLLTMNNTALESCIINNAQSVLCNLNATANIVNGFTNTVATIDVGVGNNARILFFGGNSSAGSTLSGYVDIGLNVVSGNRIKAALSAAATKVHVLDDSVTMSETLDNGFVFGFGFKGQDFSRNGSNPSGSNNTGNRQRGHVFWNGAAQAGQPIYWINTTGGANSTYVAGPNL